jgi:hypothetical protein
LKDAPTIKEDPAERSEWSSLEIVCAESIRAFTFVG